jgi:cytochrome c-type biogenesis protein
MIILLGLLLLFGRNPFARLPQIRMRLFSHPFVNAFIYGLLYGPIALPCSGPFLVSIFALSVTVGDLLGKLGIFFWFGLGFGVPLLALSLLSGATATWITRQFARRARLINLVGGFLLVGIGIYDLVQNWELIQTYLS